MQDAYGYAYRTKEGTLDPSTVGTTEQMAKVNALWNHGRVAVTNRARPDEIAQAFDQMTATIGGALAHVRITEVQP